MASVSVKVPTIKVIAMLEEKIATLHAEVANYPKAKEEYVLARKQYEKDLLATAIDALTNKPELIGDNYDSPIRVQFSNYGRSGSVSVSFDPDALGFPSAPVEPQNPNNTEWIGREHTTKLAILENTLKTLRLTEQETINASTYANVMKFL